MEPDGGDTLSTGIEWTDETKVCVGCREAKPLTDFARDVSRSDGLTYRCRLCRNARYRAIYVPQSKPRERGRQFVAARDGDVKQARRRVNYLIEAGLLSAPNILPCTDCGHVWAKGERRHEYDHHLGYAAEHHEDVEPVCTTCHHAREQQRQAA